MNKVAMPNTWEAADDASDGRWHCPNLHEL